MKFRDDGKFDITTLGEALVEFSFMGREQFGRGYSGDPVNVGVAACRLGMRVALLSSVGKDAMGEWLLQKVNEEGIYTDAVTVENGVTGIYFITLRENGEHQFTYYRRGTPASMMKLNERQKEVIRSSRVLHASGITQAIGESASASLLEAFSIAKREHCFVSYDVNYRPSLTDRDRAMKKLEDVRDLVDILFISSEDYELLFGKKDEGIKIAREMKTRGFNNVVVKEGNKGSVALVDGMEYTAKTFRINAVDTTGAGDAYDAGFICSLLEGRNVKEAMEFGSATAALKCMKKGGTRGLPGRRKVEQFLKKAARRSPGRKGMG